MQYIYLAGPIKGLTYAQIVGWRYEIENELRVTRSRDIRCLSPLRGKDHLPRNAPIAASYEQAPTNDVAWQLSTAKGLTVRDRYDVQRASLLIVNFLGASAVSIGTVMEIAWADARRIPIIVIMEPDNPHQHPMITEAASYIVAKVEDAILLALNIL